MFPYKLTKIQGFPLLPLHLDPLSAARASYATERRTCMVCIFSLHGPTSNLPFLTGKYNPDILSLQMPIVMALCKYGSNESISNGQHKYNRDNVIVNVIAILDCICDWLQFQLSQWQMANVNFVVNVLLKVITFCNLQLHSVVVLTSANSTTQR